MSQREPLKPIPPAELERLALLGIGVLERDGKRGAVQLIPVPEDAPAEIREGLTRRNIVNTGGTCPCGARIEHLDGATIWHEPGCSADDAFLTERLKIWHNSKARPRPGSPA